MRFGDNFFFDFEANPSQGNVDDFPFTTPQSPLTTVEQPKNDENLLSPHSGQDGGAKTDEHVPSVGTRMEGGDDADYSPSLEESEPEEQNDGKKRKKSSGKEKEKKRRTEKASE